MKKEPTDMINNTNKIKVTIDALGQSRTERLFNLTGLVAAESGFKTDNDPPADGYKEFNGCNGARKHYWIKGEFDTPDTSNENESLFLEIATGISGWDANNPQMLIYLNGKMVQGIDVNHREVSLKPSTHYEMYNYCYTAEQACDFPVRHSVVKLFKNVEKLYYDMLIPFEACRDVYDNNSQEYLVTVRILEETANILDLRNIPSKAYYDSVDAAIEYINREYYEKLCSTEGKPKVNCIGHTHIDVEWLWDRATTKEKIQRSFATAKALMDEYPEYRFMLSQPQLYKYLKEEAPEKFEELKALVKDKKWEPEGSFFVECDCNLSSGESLVRQIMYGKRFFKNEFGTDCHTLFLPDVFGYAAALPQILKKSGVDYFITSKISWNDVNTMPHDSFMWQGIDGTEIFTNFITGQKHIRGQEPARGTTYVGNNDAAFIYGTWERNKDKDYTTSSINTFGHGDGGGGPTKEMLEKLRRLAKGLPGFPVAVTEFIYPYFTELEKEFLENAKKLRKMPKWVGELYLEFHRGTYTTQANNKRDNRRSEYALTKAEVISLTDMLLGGDYDKSGLDENWEKVLHLQFHDILPGSSINEVYRDSAKDYAEILAYAKGVAENKLKAIAEKLNTDGGILVYNSLGFPRRAHINVDGKHYITNELIPAFGYAVITPDEHKNTLKASSHYLENERYEIKFDELGRFSSIYDKKAEREVISGPANEIRFFEDRPIVYDAWELDLNYATKCYIPDEIPTEEIIVDGDRVGIKYSRKYFATAIEQTVWVYSGSDRIDIETEVDWQERHQIMKLAFPLDVHSESATFEIQYGHTARSTTRNTSWDAAKYEVCAHKWVDLSECGYGIALLNDGKYGYSVDENTVSVSCLRGPTYPDKEADFGKHKFTVSLLPHVGGIKEGKVIEEAYALNVPTEYMPAKKTNGTASDNFSLISGDYGTAILECVKRAEDSDDMIVRLYEAHNAKTKVTLKAGFEFSKVYLTDLQENVIEELPVNGGEVTLKLKNFEIATLKFVK